MVEGHAPPWLPRLPVRFGPDPLEVGVGVEALFYGPGILANRNRVSYGTDES